MVRQDFWSGLCVTAFALLALFWIIPNYAGSNPFLITHLAQLLVDWYKQ